jgi:hypothetical protein
LQYRDGSEAVRRQIGDSFVTRLKVWFAGHYQSAGSRHFSIEGDRLVKNMTAYRDRIRMLDGLFTKL